MSFRVIQAVVVVLASVVAACRQAPWPEPPRVDEAQYRAQYAEWLNERQAVALEAARILGIWTVAEGDTSFGGDPSAPIALPRPAGPPRIGLIRRRGEAITVVPTPGVTLRWADGTRVARAAPFDRDLAFGSLRLHLDSFREAEGNRRFMAAWDEEVPSAGSIPAVDVYPVDIRWRVAARFEAFSSPATVRLATVQGGSVEAVAPGRLVFRLGGRQFQLTAIDDELGDEFLVLFKDDTNQHTTYGGHRQLYCPAVRNGEWTVLDFNLTANPPCAYSPHTLCSLPPRENRVPMAVEAGERRYPGR